VEEQGIGGLIMSAGTPTEVAVKLNAFQSRAAVPLLVAADLEAGAGFRLRGAVHIPTGVDLGGATEFPLQMALGAAGDPMLAYEMGRITALEARAVGIHVPFAPILDVNNNPDNPIINVRSFGEDPVQVARMGAEYVRGIQENGAIATGKHFPGHGDTGVDTHLSLASIDASAARLDTVELVPFRAAVSAGIGGIMTAHVSVPALSGVAEPATLSRPVMTALLRERMGFDGLLFTDAMDMGAIDRGFGREEATIRAVEAGADVILMPPSVETAIDALVGAVLSGRLTEQRIDASALRILRAKEALRLHVDPIVNPERIAWVVGIPEHMEVARTIAERSLVLLKNERDLLPLDGSRAARVLSVTFRRANDLLAGRHFNGVLRETYPRLVAQATDRDTPGAVWGGLSNEARGSQLVVVSIYVTAWDAGAISEDLIQFIEKLADDDVPHVVISFGNPYLLRAFPAAQSYLLAWSGAEVSQRAAAAALFGRIPITGRMPTRVPPDYGLGAGIQLPARATSCYGR
jgi:beta-N-acetylhexosaminidase